MREGAERVAPGVARYCLLAARWLVHGWSGPLQTYQKCKKCLILLALPRGLEPLFSP